jgi:phosphopantothenoylcysteine synthetase/decarboxylase
MNEHDHDTLMITKSLTEANAKAIKELAEAVKELATTVREEDKELRASMTKVLEVQTECKYRWESVEQRLNDKKEILEEVKKQLDKKADSDDFSDMKNFIHKALWWLFGSMSAIIAYLIKITIFKG